MVNNEMAQFIRACAHCQLVNSCSHEANQLPQKIHSDNPFDMVFLDFWEPRDILDRDRSRNILTCMDCMTRFELGAAIRLKEITSYQAARWDFGNFFVPFGIPKIIVVDADGIFDGMFKKTF